MALSSGILGPLHYSSLQVLTIAHRGRQRYVILGELRRRARPDPVLHSAVSTQKRLLLLVLPPLLLWARPLDLLRLGTTSRHLQPRLDTGALHGRLGAAVGTRGDGMVGRRVGRLLWSLRLWRLLLNVSLLLLQLRLQLRLLLLLLLLLLWCLVLYRVGHRLILLHWNSLRRRVLVRGVEPVQQLLLTDAGLHLTAHLLGPQDLLPTTLLLLDLQAVLPRLLILVVVCFLQARLYRNK